MEDEQFFEDQEQFRNLHFRMYENKYPQIEDLVYVKIDEKLDIGSYNVSLLEYDNIKGILFTYEKSNSKRKKIVNNNIPIGKELIVRILRIDSQKGFIDLSNKNIKEEEKKEITQKFGKSKAVEGIIKILSVHTNKSMEFLYKNIIWPLYKTYQHALDALKCLLNGDTHIFENLKISDSIKNELINILKKRLVPEPIKIRSIFRLTCYTFNGIDDIRNTLLNGEKIGTKDIPIKFRLVTPPLYECEVITINKNEGFKIIQSGLNEVKKSIKEKGGSFKLKIKPIIIGENAKNIEEQIKEALNNKEDEYLDEKDQDEEIESFYFER